jgi:hypothetical protein
MNFPHAASFDRHDALPIRDLPLSGIERRVVHLGRGDADRGGDYSLRWPRLRAMLAVLTGIRAAPTLSDPRLETLRRYAAAVRRCDPRSDVIAAELRAFGFSADALGTATALARR